MSEPDVKTRDIPQASNLQLVRSTVDAVIAGCSTSTRVAQCTGASKRHAEYAIQSARVLGFVEHDDVSGYHATERGLRLGHTDAESIDEARELASAINESEVMRRIAPNLLSRVELSKGDIAESIAHASGLASSTAGRRGSTILSWRRYLERRWSDEAQVEMPFAHDAAPERVPALPGNKNTSLTPGGSHRQHIDILDTLHLPVRYEALQRRLGEELVKILVAPADAAGDLAFAATTIQGTGEGLFVPLLGQSGVGKTTLADNLGVFGPTVFTQTASMSGAGTRISHEALRSAAMAVRKQYRVNESRIIPINIDDREGAPPDNSELSEIKRFLRTDIDGCPPLVLWPETSAATAHAIAMRYVAIAGRPPIELPVEVKGPSRESWVQICQDTLEVCNGLPGYELAEVAVDPSEYDPSEYTTLGEFMKAVSYDFKKRLHLLRSELTMPITLVVVFVSESLERGVLTEFTRGVSAGLLDPGALLQASPNSGPGKFWTKRRGGLINAVLRLNARTFSLPPATTVTILRRYGPEKVQELLDDLGVPQRSPKVIQKYIGRSDFGKFLAGDDDAPYEARGRPAIDAQAGLRLLAESYRYDRGRDKALNRAVLGALSEFMEDAYGAASGWAERKLSFADIIPDICLEVGGRVYCIEFAWRKGEFLATSHRGDAAKYVLEKLRNYALALKWTEP